MEMCLLMTLQSDLHTLLAPVLNRCGLNIQQARTLREATIHSDYELILIDLRTSGGMSDTLCMEARQRWPAHILALVNQHDSMRRSLALELGADALLSAPFPVEEIEARIRSLRRRSVPRHSITSSDKQKPITQAIQLDKQTRQLRLPGARLLDLSDSECAVLDALIKQPGRAVSRGELIATTELSQGSRNPNVVELAVSRLRRKLALLDGSESMIKTVRGQGYAWTGSSI